jgi:hypothetical protein
VFRKQFIIVINTHRICGLVEVGEQEVEHDSMTTDEINECDRIVAIVPDHQLESVEHNCDELNLKWRE